MKKVPGNESFQRMNYLYQISKCVAEQCPALSSYYGNLLINVAKKSVLKVHPDIKRQICKKCHCMLVNNATAKINIKTENKTKFIIYKCRNCKTQKRLPIDKNKDHKIWVERTEAIVEIVN